MEKVTKGAVVGGHSLHDLPGGGPHGKAPVGYFFHLHVLRDFKLHGVEPEVARGAGARLAALRCRQTADGCDKKQDS